VPTFSAGAVLTAAQLNVMGDDIDLIGGAWQTYVPTYSATGGGAAIGNGTIAGRYKLIGDKTCHVQIKLTMGSTTTYGTGNLQFTVPTGTMQETTALFPLGVGLIIDASPTNRYVCGALVQDSTHVNMFVSGSPGATVQATSPITFTTSDSIYVSFTYELA
jgi:hypothetical protein